MASLIADTADSLPPIEAVAAAEFKTDTSLANAAAPSSVHHGSFIGTIWDVADAEYGARAAEYGAYRIV